MALSLVSPAQWQGGHLDTYCEVWVIISFEHPRKGEIRGGVVVFAVAPNNGGDEWEVHCEGARCGVCHRSAADGDQSGAVRQAKWH